MTDFILDRTRETLLEKTWSFIQEHFTLPRQEADNSNDPSLDQRLYAFWTGQEPHAGVDPSHALIFCRWFGYVYQPQEQEETSHISCSSSSTSDASSAVSGEDSIVSPAHISLESEDSSEDATETTEKGVTAEVYDRVAERDTAIAFLSDGNAEEFFEDFSLAEEDFADPEERGTANSLSTATFTLLDQNYPLTHKQQHEFGHLYAYLKDVNWELSCWYRKEQVDSIQKKWIENWNGVVIPHFDWCCQEEEHLEEEHTGICQMCGKDDLTNVCHMVQKKYDMSLGVGTECCSYMLWDKNSVHEAQNRMRENLLKKEKNAKEEEEREQVGRLEKAYMKKKALQKRKKRMKNKKSPKKTGSAPRSRGHKKR